MEPTSDTPRHPVVFALGTTVAWLVLLSVFTALASAALGTRFDSPAALTAGRLLVAACVALWLW